MIGIAIIIRYLDLATCSSTWYVYV